MSIVYRLTNIKNGKSYIGFTTNSLDHRWRQHLANALQSNTILANAIRKYGKDGFDKEILYESADSAFTKHEMEEHFIRTHRTHYTEGGYNMTFGGDGVDKGTVPWNRGNGTYMTGSKNPMFGKPRPIGVRKKISLTKQTRPFSLTVGRYVRTNNIKHKAMKVHQKQYLITTPSGDTKMICGLKSYCSLHNLHYNRMNEVANGHRPHHKGFRVTVT